VNAMDHQSAIELFDDYLDGELSEPQQKKLEQHLEGCDSCRDELEELRQTLDFMGSLRKVEPPTEFVGKVQQRINKRSRGRFFGGQEKILVRIPFEWISFVIIVIMLVMYLMTVAQQPKIKPSPTPGKTKDIHKPVPLKAPGPERRPKPAPKR